MKKVMRFLMLAVAATGLFAACGNKGGSAQSDAPSDSDSILSVANAEGIVALDSVSTAADELFDDFIFNFAVNKRLQKNRIKFPLAEVRGEKTSHIAAAQWKMDFFFMRQDYYTLLFDNEQELENVKDTDVCNAIVEKIYFSKKSVKQYFFSRENGKWMLTRIEYIPISMSHNASFLQFYERFATDSAFQSQSLSETVRFVGPDPDDDFSQMEGLISPDTWAAFAPQLPSKMIYNIVYGHPRQERNSKVFVLRGIANGLEMELSFKRKDGRWKLTKMTT